MLLWITRVALVVGAVVGVVFARRRTDHHPFAIFMVWIPLAETVRAALAAGFGLLRPLGSPPFSGAARIAFHIDEALFLSSSTGLAAIVIVLFAARLWRAVLPIVAWAGLVAYLATHYPEVRGEALRDVYLGADLATLTVAAGAIITWTWRRASPTPAHICVLLFCLMDWVTVLGGSLRWGLWDRWYLDQIATVITYLILIAYHVAVWRSPSA